MIPYKRLKIIFYIATLFLPTLLPHSVLSAPYGITGTGYTFDNDPFELNGIINIEDPDITIWGGYHYATFTYNVPSFNINIEDNIYLGSGVIYAKCYEGNELYPYQMVEFDSFDLYSQDESFQLGTISATPKFYYEDGTQYQELGDFSDIQNDYANLPYRIYDPDPIEFYIDDKQAVVFDLEMQQVPNTIDNCPNNPDKTDPGVCGCDVPDDDIDSDGTPDCIDNCPNDPNKTDPGVCECGIPDTDSDGDGIPDCNDDCDNSLDSDGDGLNDCDDLCPFDPYKINQGTCGCGIDDNDSDGDGTLDCIDNCPKDPKKTVLGICGCGIPDTDNDLDGTPNCIDNCFNDPNKTMPGVCGCGILETDSDGDGIPDCNDNCNNSIDSDGDGLNDCDDLCPRDPNKKETGVCGCGIADTDIDGDGLLDCRDLNDDNDGIPDGVEQGPNGHDPNYDGNYDGTADFMQGNVASFHTIDYQNYVTLQSPVGTLIRNCSAEDNPSESNSPIDVDFSFGFFKFSIDNVSSNGGTTASLYIPVGESFNTYYKYGPTPDNPTNHWYEFIYDGQTGALIDGNVITLHFVDGLRGDDDLTINGTISDIGAPGLFIDSGDSSNSGSQVVTSSGGGGGGCFISSATD